MFILSYKLGNVQGTDVTVAVPAPVACEVEEAYIVASIAVASGADPKVVCEVYADDDATVLYSGSSETSGFGENAPVALTLQDGASKRYEAGQAIQLKLDFTNSIASATDICFYLKCKLAREL